MKVLIVYDTKHGFTAKCARYLNEKLPGSVIHELSDNLDISEFDIILLGTYIYVGEVSEIASNFLKTHKNKLLNKKLGMFCSAIDKDDYLNALQKSLEPEIFYHAKIVLSGGKVDFKDLSFFEKRKLKKRINVIENTEEFHPDTLDYLLDLMKK